METAERGGGGSLAMQLQRCGVTHAVHLLLVDVCVLVHFHRTSATLRCNIHVLIISTSSLFPLPFALSFGPFRLVFLFRKILQHLFHFDDL